MSILNRHSRPEDVFRELADDCRAEVESVARRFETVDREEALEILVRAWARLVLEDKPVTVWRPDHRYYTFPKGIGPFDGFSDSWLADMIESNTGRRAYDLTSGEFLVEGDGLPEIEPDLIDEDDEWPEDYDEWAEDEDEWTGDDDAAADWTGLGSD